MGSMSVPISDNTRDMLRSLFEYFRPFHFMEPSGRYS